MEFYVGRNPVRRWRAEVDDATEAMVFSPYVTSSTAESVLLGRPARLFTNFDPLAFLHGSSSLFTLRRLVRSGCQAFHIPDLHAKLVLVPGRFFSIGSQNLTVAGTRRREAVAVCNDPRLVKELGALVEPWVAAATPVTEDMIDRLLETLFPFIRAYRKVVREVLLAAAELEAEVEARRHEEQLVVAEAALRASRMQALQHAVQRAASAHSASAGLRLTTVPSGWGNEIWTLLADRTDLLSWHLGDRDVRLERKNRYLCLMPASGRLGWARLMKTRISFIGEQIHWTEDLSFGKWALRPMYVALDPAQHEGNLQILLGGLVQIDSWFSLDGLEAIRITPSGSTVAAEELAEHVESEWEDVGTRLRHRLLKPFVYKENLYGVSPRDFVGSSWGSFRLSLAGMDADRFLVLTSA